MANSRLQQVTATGCSTTTGCSRLRQAAAGCNRLQQVEGTRTQGLPPRSPRGMAVCTLYSCIPLYTGTMCGHYMPLYIACIPLYTSAALYTNSIAYRSIPRQLYKDCPAVYRYIARRSNPHKALKAKQARNRGVPPTQEPRTYPRCP